MECETTFSTTTIHPLLTTELQNTDHQTSIPSSSSFIAPLSQNHTCDPFSPRETPCTLGNLPAYAINATNYLHVSLAIKFAKARNVRIIIKSTGHDLLGKSSGAHSLSIWLHNFKNIGFTKQYNGPNKYNNYHGPAAIIEPGLLSYEIYEKAKKAGYRVIGGTCNTVAVGGGYTQGGGHSLLSGKHGLSADNVLEWRVVTSSGDLVTATPDQNSDLYWALAGGGPGVWGVVISMTVKVYPEDGMISGAGVTFSLASAPNEDTFWKGVEVFHKFLPAWLDQGFAAPYVLALGMFSLQPLTLPGKNSNETRSVIAPFLSALDGLKIPYDVQIQSFSSYLDLFAQYYGPMPYGIYTHTQVSTSRLIPRSTVQNRTAELISTYRKIWSFPGGPFWILGNGIHVPAKPSAAAENAVHPAWREADIQQIVLSQWKWNGTWEENVRDEEVIEGRVIPMLEGLSQGSGTYMNEGNVGQQNWQREFYGGNWGRLQGVKRKWDPEGVFYAKMGVGSEEWVEDGEGRLCKI